MPVIISVIIVVASAWFLDKRMQKRKKKNKETERIHDICSITEYVVF
ncbi:MAG: hypothetical protein FWC16_02870 [Defluviitaleaceae bacterium]|nr:hypothetical protein [Defluviitaleaceae bacterium]MCL2273843.1 hypothetical protein [Defluviitaleaceae bacterium]